MQSSDSEEIITDINVTPLVDVCLVLVIIFMVVAPFTIQAGIYVLQTRATAAVGKVAAGENVKVKLTQKGRLTVNNRPSTFEKLAEDIREALTKSRDRMVIVSADYKNRVGKVVWILDTAKQVGAVKVALLKNN